ncbi:MAG: outer membrane beta-barrel protein [Bacteroidales bacterium]|jgi:hypothetical protein|nr:outer membrane beta-barrel protein [Bacteroidales bacterium]MDD4384880.1 outer membrane beta-barrel protein [Bacteroidales bacterium]MDY0197008.1 outer membrane beta-barrel protein [Tenuifilaceae bacterium]
MKTLITVSSLILLFTSSTIAQEEKTEKVELNLKIVEQRDSTTNNRDADKQYYDDFLKQAQEIDISDQRKSDTTSIRFGKKRIVIIEKDGSTSIEIPGDNNKFTFDSDEDRDFNYKSKPRFKGHWAGLEWGFNGFMTPDHSINMTDEYKFLELRQGRSWNINLNFMQYSLGIVSDKIGLVTGLGFEFNDYHFRNPITLKVVDGITVADSSYFLDPNKNVTKTKLSTIHFTVPLLMEFQIPAGSRDHRVFISAGVIGGVKIESHTKIVFDGVSKGKDKGRSDYNLSTFRYGLTARIGYRGLKLFANYYPTPLFEKGKGTEVNPFSVGLILLSFR